METYKYDVFISFTEDDKGKVRPIYERMKDCGLRVFWSDKVLEPGTEIAPEIEEALKKSRHFALYCSKKATESKWVEAEWRAFWALCHQKHADGRLMYVLLEQETCSETDLPRFLQSYKRPESSDHLIAAIIKSTLDAQSNEFGHELDRLRQQLGEQVARDNEIITQIRDDLNLERRKLDEARKFYRHNRFWTPIARNHEVHIFTCGRNVPHDPKSPRGYGGRTNIDMWDYRAVLDITHYFASKYPNTRITIEDPVSKLDAQEFSHPGHFADRMARMIGMLQSKDCIIIGSSDVSDFAEISLAHIHGIDPYTEGRAKTKGFVIIKEKKHPISAFYWEREKQEEEGVARILGQGRLKYFRNEPPTGDGATGKMYGILVVANNPFPTDEAPRKIVILSGFSGLATNAISKLLTSDGYLSEFYRLDNEYVNLDGDVEVLVGVEYTIGSDFASSDTRHIESITFEELVEL